MPFCWNGLGIIPPPPLLSPTTSLLLWPPPRQAPQHTSKTVIRVAFVLGKSRVCPRDSKMQDAATLRLARSKAYCRRGGKLCVAMSDPPPPHSSVPPVLVLLELVAIALANHWTALSISCPGPCTVPAASLKKLLVKKGLDESPTRRFQCVKLALARRVPLVASNHHLCEVGP